MFTDWLRSLRQPSSLKSQQIRKPRRGRSSGPVSSALVQVLEPRVLLTAQPVVPADEQPLLAPEPATSHSADAGCLDGDHTIAIPPVTKRAPDPRWNRGTRGLSAEQWIAAQDVATEVEPNNTFGAAEAIMVPTADILTAAHDTWLEVSGAITAGDTDFYTFTLTQQSGVFIDIDARDINATGSLDSIVTIFNSSQNQLAVNDDGYDFEGFAAPDVSTFNGTSLDSSLYIDLGPGTYFVRVTPFAGTGDYQLRMLADTGYSSSMPVLNSLSTAGDSLFLDFDGHSATDAWGTYTAAAYDFNGNGAQFTPGERLAIYNTWKVIAEDYSPFNINVTTVQPPTFNDGLAYRLIMTSSPSSLLGFPTGVLGVAFLNSYGGGGATNQAGWVFGANFSEFIFAGEDGDSGRIMASALEMGNTGSHEFGHALGLNHYSSNGSLIGVTLNPLAIMATPDLGLSREIWGQGTAESIVQQDDDTLIASGTNTFGYRTDDHGSTTTTASILINGAATGVIENVDTNDLDIFAFTSIGTETTFRVNVDEYSADLDPVLSILDFSGNVITTSNPTGAVDASLTLTLAAGDYFLMVSSNGQQGEIGQYTIQAVSSAPNNPPVIVDQTLSVQEGSLLGTVVGTVVASDPDAGQGLTYAIIGGNLSNAFAINAVTGQITVNDPTKLDFETQPQVALTVQVTDNGLPNRSASATVTINVLDGNDLPTDIGLSPSSVAENRPLGTVVGSFTTTDPNPGNTFTYALVSGSGSTDNASFTVVGNQLRTAAIFDFEAKSNYTVRVRSTDLGGLSVDKILTVAITNGNDVPSISLTNKLSSLSEAANTAAPIRVADIVIQDDGLGTNNLSVTGTDAALFQIVGNQLQLKAGVVLDFETKPSLAVSVQVDDPAVGGTPDGTASMTLTIINANEPPAVELLNPRLTIQENINTTSPIAVATITILDDALGVETLSLSGEDAAAFEIAGNQLRIKAGTKVDYESTDNLLQVSVSVNDAAVGTSPDDTADLAIQVINVNEAPTLVVQSITPTLPETATTTSDRTVANVFVNDDALGTNTLTLSGADAFSFKLVGTQLQLKAGTKLDFETKASLSVNVVLNDPAVGGTPDASFNFRLTITDVNEPPVVTPRTFSIPARAARGTAVGTVTATDPEVGQFLTYSITGGNTNGAFAINSSTGQLIVSNARAVRQPGIFKLTVKATDSGSPAASGQAVMTINVGAARVAAPTAKPVTTTTVNPAPSQVAVSQPASTTVPTKSKKVETTASPPAASTTLLSRVLTAIKPKPAVKK